MVWYFYIVSETIWSHAGYKIGSKLHDIHHKINIRYNYGNQLFMDRLFGTLTQN
jgi:sterol desaturase/sphingolipid hydroxylase (fatty acid hydroxylase superfamily)